MNNLFLVNILLALIWAAVSGSFSEPNLLFGFVLGMIVLFVIREQVGTMSYLFRAKRILSLIGLFLVELAKSAIKVAKLAVSRNLNLKPGFFAYHLNTDRDFEITILANLITLTPGTLSVDVSEDKKILYVHAVTIDDVEKMRADIANGFERKIMEAFR
ncbi:Na+/H+ antiporter subunit E [Cohaesibacter celericrescens]|jgi:multicomponent Na+:H+ antiporter subunit E|uniref:Na+/H+ antiporter subunit E n=1 Tax=Cohaesibacter celericrescens TaxID=2067669 RepID=A0A2N5XR60_9HYPH|nr:Na+/H+ antiporter subunit E [Cohaesibacter celericrescens]PLW76984.1 Na+/H+ antiporter subunit E [Cohaesibacter celericrescens]